MGKCKKRSFNKNTEFKGTTLKREDVVSDIVLALHQNNLTEDSIKNIHLFGITQEELSEAGAVYEELLIFEKYII